MHDFQVVSGSRDKTVLVQDFWLKESDFVKSHPKAEEDEELSREQQRMLRRKAILQRVPQAAAPIRRY